MRQHQEPEPARETGTALETSGNLMRIRINSDVEISESKEQPKCGKKKKQEGFSAKSRLAFARAMAATDWPQQPAHVTLTYGQSTPEMTGNHFKDDLEKLNGWMVRHGMAGFWRLEFQERKQSCLEFLSRCSCISNQQLSLLARHRRCAHFHLLALGMTEELEGKLRKWWNRRIKDSLKLSAQGSPQRLVESMSKYTVKVTYREAGKAAWYLALHGQKESQAPNISVGRWWGYFGKDRVMSYQTWQNYGTLSEASEFRLRRIIRRMLKRKTKGTVRQSVTVFMSQKTQRKLVLYLFQLEHGEQAITNNQSSLESFATTVFRDELEPF